jgi:hypothetical protein
MSLRCAIFVFIGKSPLRLISWVVFWLIPNRQVLLYDYPCVSYYLPCIDADASVCDWMSVLGARQMVSCWLQEQMTKLHILREQ